MRCRGSCDATECTRLAAMSLEPYVCRTEKEVLPSSFPVPYLGVMPSIEICTRKVIIQILTVHLSCDSLARMKFVETDASAGFPR